MSDDSNVVSFPTPIDPIEDAIFEEKPKKPSDEEQFFTLLYQFAQIGLATARAKNKDYAGNGDPFANFRNSEAVGVSTARGMLVRMMDKVARISNLITRPPAVANESLLDTCVDLAMYALILAAYIKMHPEADG
jgi:hypothetical protein